MDQQVAIFLNAFHPFRIGHKVGRKVAAIKTHSFDEIEGCFQTLGFFDRNDAFFADLIHGFGQNIADGFVIVSGNSADLGDFVPVAGRFGDRFKLVNDFGNRFVDAALDAHGIVPGSNQFYPLAKNCP